MIKQKCFCLIGCSIATLFLSLSSADAKRQCGTASWYSLIGRKTASGEIRRRGVLTGAHRTLRFGTRVTVRNMRNNRTVRIRINDRGPFIRGRIVDVSKAAARRLGFVSRGTTRVCITY
ncbi:MAG: septal ring lytic transglycosylase RlpA family protein [Pseudomonadota bacterium]